jgi:HEAT repeat protein
MGNLLLLACLGGPLQDLPSDEDAERAVRELKKGLQETADDAKIAALREALKVVHEKVIRAVGDLLTSASDTVRVACADALRDIDHPASVAVLTAAIPANLKTPSVAGAIVRALGRLGWESAAAPLHDLLKRAADAATKEEVVGALGQIGSVSSIKVLFEMLPRLKDGNEEERKLRRRAITALDQIAIRKEDKKPGTTGFTEKWWEDNRERLLAGVRRTYWSKKTHERTVVGPGEKPPADSVLVCTRITDAPGK